MAGVVYTVTSVAQPEEKFHWLRLYFNCLRCRLCGDFYEGDDCDPKGPRHLDCDCVLCEECLDAQKALDEDERSHNCPRNADYCVDDSQPAYYLYDIIWHFTRVTSKKVISMQSIDDLGDLKCLDCKKPYSLKEEGTTPFVLSCAHACCFACYKKSRVRRMMGIAHHSYKVTCAYCTQETITDWEKSGRDDELYGFLKQLDSLKAVLDNSTAPLSAAIFNCAECERKVLMDDIWQCHTCDMLVCSTCRIRKRQHFAHAVEGITERRISILVKQKTPILENQLNTYSNLIPELLEVAREKHKTCLTTLNAGLASVKRLSIYGDAHAHVKQCLEFGDGFEQSSEEFVAAIKKHTKDVEDLIENAAKRFKCDVKK